MMRRDPSDRSADRRSRWPKRCLTGCHGSVLLLTAVLLSLLSVLILLAVNYVLLGMKARESLQASLEMFHIAEAGLAHGEAFCAAHGETSPALASAAEKEAPEEDPAIEDPFGRWFPFGRGEYRIRAFRLGTDTQPFLSRDSGVLFVSTGRLEGEGRRRACLLIEEPPSCLRLAWWEPD